MVRIARLAAVFGLAVTVMAAPSMSDEHVVAERELEERNSITCSAGYYIGYSSKRTHNKVCLPCAAGTYSKKGKSCSKCGKGYFSQAAAAECSPCPVDTYIYAYGSSYCSPCATGYWTNGLTGQKKCVVKPQPCSAGYYKKSSKKRTSSSSSGVCYPCALGYYGTDGLSCVKCPAGTYASKTGTSACTTCPSNHYSGAGASYCITCPSNKIHNSDHTACINNPSSRALRRAADKCAEGFTSCPIPGRANVFECVDTNNDIQSCGACRSSGEGEDCTAFDDRATATCVSGKCQYVCPTGYTLTATGCVESS